MLKINVYGTDRAEQIRISYPDSINASSFMKPTLESKLRNWSPYLSNDVEYQNENKYMKPLAGKIVQMSLMAFSELNHRPEFERELSECPTYRKD
jgi:hypothetical protein